MPKPYKLEDGTRVPSVTTILKELGDGMDGLIRWAYNLGLDGKDLDDEQDRACTVGSMAHACAEASIKGLPPPTFDAPPEDINRAEACLTSFEAWRSSTRLELVASELRLVSEEYGYGGTIDAIVMLNGRPGILDFKSAKRLYVKTVAQVAAYSELWKEHNPDIKPQLWAVLRWDPDGSFTYHSLSASCIAAGWQIFSACHNIYDQKKLIRL